MKFLLLLSTLIISTSTFATCYPGKMDCNAIAVTAETQTAITTNNAQCFGQNIPGNKCKIHAGASVGAFNIPIASQHCPANGNVTKNGACSLYQ